MTERLLPAVLLAGALAALWWFVRGDLAEYRVFRSLGDGRSRRMRYRLWVVKAVIGFALPTALGLAALGRLEALAMMPAEFAGLAAVVGPLPLGSDDVLNGGIVGGALGGMIVGTLWALRRRRQGRDGPMLGDIGSLMPRSRDELGYGALLSLSAGVTEEMFFRLLLPLLIALVVGSPLAGFVVATLLFGAVHRYQGWLGVAATTVMGALFSAVYLATGLLWVAMLLHVFIDLNGLVIRPALTGAWRGSA